MKKTVFLFIVCIGITNCNNATQQEVLVNNHETLVKQYFEYFNQHNWEKLASMYADTAQFKDPTLGKGIVPQTRQQTIKKYSELNVIFPDLKDKVINVYPSSGNHIIVEFVSTGTGPDQVKFELPICTILTIENGLITKDFTYFDNFEEAAVDNK
jgi:predicted double-glycine peptidase